ncbi:RHH-type transcriptional regulator, rel operon repressor / antitoxin RelB [Nitratiruptor sp. YY08-26]|uniref:type II toxin-antitoxin system RelB family antitoxin n=1 Tax=unclassified Nitratiruptor TaxID=2624044 RepID=UPI00191662F9|nr:MULTISPECIES: ribbon-helix-helix domain-containing protein [unclassified Nitratiruptor]BCD62083.1 RHH-type transcriptional regulator, rel operon repressor / antitoxin RelB [Nitratiruptor sp. YY08-13]BCD66019.1 RHH-type transcriptional regulator, rel operon repressor / antitoxin RelB [Nitratiruptor sp. YY08-26]
MLTVRLDKELEQKLEKLAILTKRPKSFFVKEALRQYLEDIEDILDAKERVNDPAKELITLDELKRELNV